VAAASVEFIWIEMRCHPLDRATAERTREACEVVAVLRDVSERKAREESRDAARAESERANAHKSRFLATMSHELRTPLNVIIGFSEMLIKEPPIVLTSARREEYAQLINESGHHLLSVVNGILDMSKIENGSFEITPELFAPARSIESCCDLLRLKASGAGIELVTRIADDMPQILADKRALNQILLNLLSNAIKFSDRGSRVTASAAADGRFLVLSVEDEGVGIGTDDLSRVGNPFFQARASYDRRHDGTGLGLSIVKGLVTLHGGELDIRSRLGEGTRVTIRLPIDCEHPHSAQSRPLRPHAPVLGTDFRVKKSA
jgi:cell cycle sensor histidine kinase DivJ